MLILAHDRERSTNSSTRIACDNWPRDYFFPHLSKSQATHSSTGQIVCLTVSNYGVRQKDGTEG